jgi:hypothetical protein
MSKLMELRVVRADLFDRDCDGSIHDRQKAYAVCISDGRDTQWLDHLRFASHAKAEERLKKLEREFSVLFSQQG